MSRRDLTYGGKTGTDLTYAALMDLFAYVLLEQSETPPLAVNRQRYLDHVLDTTTRHMENLL